MRARLRLFYYFFLHMLYYCWMEIRDRYGKLIKKIIVERDTMIENKHKNHVPDSTPERYKSIVTGLQRQEKP